MRCKPRWAIVLVLALPVRAQAQAEVNASNWQHSPAIDSIRSLVKHIDARLSHLRSERDSSSCAGGDVILISQLFVDSAGVVRKYTLEGGSGDSAGEERYYYGSTGALRFIYARTGAANGTEREDRFYYSSKGMLLYHDQRLLHGPGYPGGFEGKPILDPQAAFKAPCALEE